MIALYIIAGLILLIVLLAFVVTTAFEHKAEIVINKPKAEVFEYVRSVKNQDNWNVHAKRDPEMKQEFVGTDGTVGFRESWEGKKAGKGSQEIKKITEGERVDVEFRFEKPFKLTNHLYFITSTVEENKTKVVFAMCGNAPRPFNIIFPLVKKSILRDFNKGLANLKAILEK